MNDLDASSRPRILLLAILVVLIGSFGALVLAPLLDAPRHGGPGRLDVQLSFELSGDNPDEGGEMLVSVAQDDGPPRALHLAVTPYLSPTEIAEGLARAADEAGVEGARAEGTTLDLPGVLDVGVDPGMTGVLVSLSASSRGPEGEAFRLGLERADDQPPETLGARVGLVATTAPESRGSGSAARFAVSLGAGGGSALAVLTEALMEKGWGVEHATPEADHLWIRTLPDGTVPRALLLTLAYEATAPGRPGWMWRVGVE